MDQRVRRTRWRPGEGRPALPRIKQVSRPAAPGESPPWRRLAMAGALVVGIALCHGDGNGSIRWVRRIRCAPPPTGEAPLQGTLSLGAPFRGDSVVHRVRAPRGRAPVAL